MLKTGTELLYNGHRYIVIIPINYNNANYYFLLNTNNKNDCFFAQYENGIVTPISDINIINSILDDVGSKLNR